MYRAENRDFDKASVLVKDGGLGHTASIYLNEAAEKKSLRILHAE